ncbi:MAG: HlyD family efflux transporter periplasmic adaptor subunit [Synechococcales bacterium]|nr:HlyD family efflux transporter periplasmic adaptor subunit [Synechococcales bacterium]
MQLATKSAAEPLWSDGLQATLDQPPATFSKRLLLGGFVFGCIFGGWAWFGHIQEVSHAQGQLVPEGQVYKVQPMIQGEVAQILVEEGEAVKTGQIIATLDTRLEQTEIERLEQSLTSQHAQLLQMQALIERTRMEGEVRQAIATADVNAQQMAITETAVDIQTLQEMLTHLDTETEAYQNRLQRLQPLVDAGAIAQDQLFEVEQSIRERQQAITQNSGNLEKSQAESDRLQAQLTRQQAEGQRSQIELQQQLQQLEREAIGIQAHIEETKALLKAARTKLDQMFVYAPCDGLVLALGVENTGEVIQAGQTIAEIAPDDAPLVLSAALPSREAGLIETGMTVNIKLDAFPYQDYGIVTGKVLSISPNAKANEQLGAVYEVDIALERDYVMHENQPVELQAGQTAHAEIVVRKQRILDLLLDPIRQLQAGGINL